MGMIKYTQAEGLDVVHGEEAAIMNKHLKRTGKRVSDFNQEELDALMEELGRKPAEEPTTPRRTTRRKKTE